MSVVVIEEIGLPLHDVRVASGRFAQAVGDPSRQPVPTPFPEQLQSIGFSRTGHQLVREVIDLGLGQIVIEGVSPGDVLVIDVDRQAGCGGGRAFKAGDIMDGAARLPVFQWIIVIDHLALMLSRSF